MSCQLIQKCPAILTRQARKEFFLEPGSINCRDKDEVLKVLQTRLEVAQQQVSGRNAPEVVPQDVLEEENIMLKAQVQELLDRNARLEVSNSLQISCQLAPMRQKSTRLTFA